MGRPPGPKGIAGNARFRFLFLPIGERSLSSQLRRPRTRSQTAAIRVRRERRRFSRGARPTRRTLQPEATGAVMEVTKWLKPSV